MDFWESNMFYVKVHGFGKDLWISGKMRCLREKVENLEKFMDLWENNIFY
jgi:hypothetical protein